MQLHFYLENLCWPLFIFISKPQVQKTRTQLNTFPADQVSIGFIAAEAFAPEALRLLSPVNYIRLNEKVLNKTRMSLLLNRQAAVNVFLRTCLKGRKRKHVCYVWKSFPGTLNGAKLSVVPNYVSCCQSIEWRYYWKVLQSVSCDDLIKGAYIFVFCEWLDKLKSLSM